MTPIFIDNQRFKLDKSQLIQSGGEGMVFALGGEAIKIYHQPTPARRAKLQDWIGGDFNSRLPPNLLGPRRLIFDKHHQTIGFQMPLLPGASQPLKRLSQPNFCQQQDLNILEVAQLFQEIHFTLSQIHVQSVVVGDLNDTNLFFLPAPSGKPGLAVKIHWIDVDSYQFDHYPCPVAKEAFLDPHLVSAGGLGQMGHFSALTDWYAYLTLLIKSLLHVHPYGGVHHQYKTIQARSQAGLSILNSAVTYPAKARPRECLSDELLHHIHLVYERGWRRPFPLPLLEQYACSLITCEHCGLSFPSQRRGCPGCQYRPPISRQLAKPSARQERLLLEVDGLISHIAVLSRGRIAAVVRQGDDYLLLRAGQADIQDTLKLSTGQLTYRFASFETGAGEHFLVVNSPGRPQLLIMHVSGSTPQQTKMLETAMFCGEAVFATTSRHIYRIAGNWIMRGGIQNGAYVEEAIATVHRAQTQFWGSPEGDVIAGYHRVFDQLHFFLIDADKIAYPIFVPPRVPGEAIAEVCLAFTKKSVAIMLQINQHGRSRVETWISNMRGEILYHINQETNELNHLNNLANLYPFTTEQSRPSPPFILLPPELSPADNTDCWPHPDGLLIQRADRLYFYSR